MNFRHHDGGFNSLAKYKKCIELNQIKVDDKLIYVLYFILLIKTRFIYIN